LAAAVGGIPLTGVQAAQQQQQRPAIVQRAPVFRPPPRLAAPHPISPRIPQVNANKGGAPKFTQPQTGNRFHAVNPNLPRRNPTLTNPAIQHVNPNLPRLNPNLAQPKGGLSTQGANALKFGPGKPVFTPVLKPGGAPLKPAFPVVSMHNRFWPILKGPKFIWLAGHRRFFVPIGLLGVALIGGSYWYPDGYVSIAGPACAGFTPDGCQLQWRMVDFEDGGGVPQCVQYCPQAGSPPAQAAELLPPPALAQNGTCQVTIYAEPEFGGLSAPTSDSQPALSETGWKNEISSIQVEAGTWDFFSAENFGGESVRLAAGSYPMLAPEWNKRIGSFMCVEPGAPGA
jgi:beta/gamma crystallin